MPALDGYLQQSARFPSYAGEQSLDEEKRQRDQETLK
jgi:hypothetical protein